MICPPSARASDKAQESYRRGDEKARFRAWQSAGPRRRPFAASGVEVKRGINPDLVEQATAQDEQYRLEDEDNLPENDAFSPDSAETVRSREAAPPR